MILQIESPAAMRAFGARIGAALRPGDVVVLIGDLGAGKTTVVQGLAPALGIAEAITSPTFVIAREHRAAVTLNHVDAYRLAGAADFWDLDLDLRDSVTVVEWGGDLLDDLTDEPVLVVTIESGAEDSTRCVTVRGTSDRWAPADLAQLAHPS